MKKFNLIALIIILLFALASCKAKGVIQVQSNNIPESAIQDANNNPENSKNEVGKVEDKTININANENGMIMILMYHGIGDKEEEWVRTSENFRKDLETLYENGYRLISLTDYINNDINVEAGCTPVAMTFDDGLLNQFNIIEENGEKKIDPKCAVGILEDFYKEKPDFGRGTSFYVYYPVPFRQKELIKEKFDFLLKNGYEIGNHSYNHPNLGKISLEEVQEQLAMNVKCTREYVPEYVVTSLALPFGAAPKGDNYKYVISGSYDGTEYNNKAILKVGSNPAPSPSNKSFDPLRLPRVRASEMNTYGTGIYDWLKYFEKNPEKRYISDGDPDTITIPSFEEDAINKENIKDKILKVYKK